LLKRWIKGSGVGAVVGDDAQSRRYLPELQINFVPGAEPVLEVLDDADTVTLTIALKDNDVAESVEQIHKLLAEHGFEPSAELLAAVNEAKDEA
jgi:hypothetical protein